MSSKTLTGTVVSTKMNKTIVVEVESSKVHGVYGRGYKVHKKFKVHYDGKDLNEGDTVIIRETVPVSKTKTWTVIKDKKSKKESK